MARILLVEDDPIITSSLSALLGTEGHSVQACTTQDEAIQLACSSSASNPYDLVLLDIALASGNGFTVCGAIKQKHPSLPVIFLTASGDEYSTVAGLGMGADDYIAKPFRPNELLARIGAALRRSHPEHRLVQLGSVSIDPERAYVCREGKELILSALEYRLLLLLATHKGHLVTRDMIREALWDDAGAYIEENTISVYIKRLRNKIEKDPAHPQCIVTIRGLGYKIYG